jgi:hypothetical protein
MPYIYIYRERERERGRVIYSHWKLSIYIERKSNIFPLETINALMLKKAIFKIKEILAHMREQN